MRANWLAGVFARAVCGSGGGGIGCAEKRARRAFVFVVRLARMRGQLANGAKSHTFRAHFDTCRRAASRARRVERFLLSSFALGVGGVDLLLALAFHRAPFPRAAGSR
jgi:hypothetical protein